MYVNLPTQSFPAPTGPLVSSVSHHARAVAVAGARVAGDTLLVILTLDLQSHFTGQILHTDVNICGREIKQSLVCSNGANHYPV